MHLFSTCLQPSITVLHLKQQSPCCRWDGFSGFLSVCLSPQRCFKYLLWALQHVWTSRICVRGLQSRAKYGGSFVLSQSEGASSGGYHDKISYLLLVGGFLSVLYVTSLFTLVSVVELNTPYSHPPLFFPTLGFTDHQGQKRSFDQTQEQQEVLQYCTETTVCKNSPFSDWFCLLSHGSPQTFKLSDWWKWLLFLTNGICMASQYGSGHEYYSWKLCICGMHSDPLERFGTISIQMLMRILGSRCRILKVSPCTETISHQAPAAGAAGSLAEESDIYRKPS